MVEPRSSRPRFPDPVAYGPHLESPTASLRTWEECRARLVAAELYWLATTRRDGGPHSVPIGAVWSEDQLWFNTNPQTVIGRALAREPRAVAHLESAEDVLIVEGVAEKRDVANLPPDVAVAYTNKYGAESDPSAASSSWVWFALAPRSAITWSFADIRNTAVRYDFG